MRTSVVIAWDAKGKCAALTLPDTPILEAKELYNKIADGTKDGGDKLVRLEFWESGSGCTKRRTWLTSDQLKDRTAARHAEAKALADLKAKAPAAAAKPAQTTVKKEK